MKNPLKKFAKKTPPGRRQRLANESERPGPNLTYYSRRSDDEVNTGRDVKRESRKPLPGVVRKFWVNKFALLALIITMAIVLYALFNLSANPKVTPVSGEKSTAFLRSIDSYQAAASKLLGSSIWNRNKVTIDTATISREMLKQFPELTAVGVTLPLVGQQPIVTIEAAQPALILVASSGQSYVIADTGKALIASSHISSLTNLKLPTVTDQSGLEVRLNAQALSSGDVSFIKEVVAQLAAKQLIVSTLTLPPGASEVDVGIEGKPYQGKFNLQETTAREQAGTFLAAQARLQQKNITPKYIDVRVAGRAYYQ